MPFFKSLRYCLLLSSVFLLGPVINAETSSIREGEVFTDKVTDARGLFAREEMRAQQRLERFLEKTETTGEAKAKGAEFLEKVIGLSPFDLETEQSIAASRLARELIKSHDLIVLTDAMWILYQDPDLLEADQSRAIINRGKVLKMIKQEKYTPEDRARMLSKFVQIDGFARLQYRGTEMMELYRSNFIEWMKSIDWENENLQLLYSETRFFAMGRKYKRQFSNLKQRQDTLKEIAFLEEKAPWLWNMINADVLYDEARQSHKSRFSKPALGTNLKFDQYFESAKEFYEAAYELGFSTAEPAAQMIIISNHLETDISPEEWFSRSFEEFIDHSQTLKNLVDELNRSNPEALIEIARLLSSTEAYDTSAPFSLGYTRQYVGPGRNIRASQKSDFPYEELKDVFEGYLSAEDCYPRFTKDFLHYGLLSWAIQYRESQEIIRLHKLVGNISEKSNRRRLSYNRSAEISRAYLDVSLLSDLGKKVREYASSSTRRDDNGRKAMIAEIDKNLERLTAGLAKDNLNAMRQQLADELRFNQGETITLPMTPMMEDWSGAMTTFRVNSPTSATFGTHHRVRFNMKNSRFFDNPMEVTLNVERHGTLWRGMLPIMIEVGSTHDRDSKFHQFFVDTVYGYTGYISKFDKWEERKMSDSPNKKSAYQMRLRIWEGYAELFLDDQLVVAIEDSLFSPGTLSIGIARRFKAGGTYTFSDVKVRMLETPNSTDRMRSEDSKIEFYDSRIATDPIWIHYALRGNAHRFNGDLEKAREDFIISHKLAPNKSYGAWRASLIDQGMGLHQKAEDLLTAASKLDKDRALTRATSLFYSTCPDEKFFDKKKALELAKKGMKNSGDSSFAYEAMSCAQAANGDFKNAIKNVNKAKSLFEKNKRKGRKDDVWHIKRFEGQLQAFKENRRYIYPEPIADTPNLDETD